MAISSDALYQHLTEDLLPHLTVDQGIAALMGGVIPDYPDETLEQFASRHLLSNVFKKLATNVRSDADERALGKFLESNRLCETWSWSKETWDLRDDILVGTLKKVIYDVFSDPRLCFSDLSYLSNKGDLGAGTNVKSNGTDLYSKLYSSALTSSSSGIFELFQRYVSSNPRMKNAEFLRTLHYGHDGHICDSRLSFVPKSNDISRTICTEPTLNMWYQRAYGKQLEQVLQSRYGIDLSLQQDINRELARIGSRDDSFVTIDLASASDTIALKFLEDVLPKEVYVNLKFLRCPRTQLPNGEKIDLHMVSSMGNGFTSALQTLIFSCLVEAAYEVYSIAMHKPFKQRNKVHLGNYGVFGDDIIVERNIYAPLCRLLELCGFRVNPTKSFQIGPFRESCGRDFHNGYNVRPVFIKSLSDERSRFTAINLLRIWSSRMRIPLNRTLAYLAKRVRWIPVPRSAPVESGLHVPFSVIRPTQDINGSFAYRCLEPVTSKVKIIGEKVIVPHFGKKKIFNPDGLILYALSGGLRDGGFSIRLSDLKYRIKVRVTPNWDSLPLGVDLLDRPGWARWDSESVAFCQRNFALG